jgi:hypothetical protein
MEMKVEAIAALVLAAAKTGGVSSTAHSLVQHAKAHIPQLVDGQLNAIPPPKATPLQFRPVYGLLSPFGRESMYCVQVIVLVSRG